MNELLKDLEQIIFKEENKMKLITSKNSKEFGVYFHYKRIKKSIEQLDMEINQNDKEKLIMDINTSIHNIRILFKEENWKI